MNTEELIGNLSLEAVRKPRLKTPAYFCAWISVFFVVYAVATQLVLGFRPDLALQLSRPMFLLELALLLLLAVTSLIAAVIAMYPDLYQKKNWLNLPYYILAVLAFFMLFQMSLPFDSRMAAPDGDDIHKMECAICIAMLSMIPSAFIFRFLSKGASVHPLRAGGFAVLAASGLGGFSLRLCEANDAVAHLLIWHYFPTVLFALVGAMIGKLLLKW